MVRTARTNTKSAGTQKRRAGQGVGRWVWLVASVMILWVWPVPAHAEEWILSLQRREAERRKERWSLSDHLAAKGASNRQDLLYQFFLGQREPRPRLELVAGGLGQSVRETVDASRVPGDKVMATAAGYGLRLAFNNFVSGLTGLPTLNMVPNFSAEVLEVDYDQNRSSFVTGARTKAPGHKLGAGFRLLGRNPSDTALYVDYTHRRLRVGQAALSVTGDDPPGALRLESVDTWLVEASGQLYLFPVLALTGSVSVDEEIVAGHERDARFRLFEHSYGGHLDLAMFRLSYSYGERTLSPRDRTQYPDAARVKTITHEVGIGVVF